MTVTLGTTPYSGWQVLAPLLESLGCAPDEQNNPERWYLAEDSSPEGHLLLAYTRPEHALVSAMEQGVKPGQALQQWIQHAEALVKRFKANRRQAVLVDVTTAQQNQEQATTALASHWQLQAELAADTSTNTTEPANAFYKLIANTAVQQNEQLQPLLAQLEACTLPLGSIDAVTGASSQDVDTLYTQLNATWQELEKQTATAKSKDQSLANLQAALKKEEAGHTKTNSEKATLENQFKALKAANKDQGLLEEENQLLLEQLHLVQEELEAKFHQVTDQEKNIENLQNSLQSTNTKLAQSSAQEAASKKEIGLFQQRLQKLRGTLEDLERTNRSLKSDLAEVKNQLAAAKKHQADWEHKYRQGERNGTLALAGANRRISELSAELNKVTKSRTWRLVNPTTSYRKKFKKIAAEKLEQQKTEIQNSDLFNEAWYLEKYPDVAEAGINPIEHYLKTGAYEGRNPSETFDTTWYLCYYRDVTESGLNPLMHYLRYGQKEERAPRPGALVSLPAPSEQNSTTPINSGEQAN